MDYWRTPLWRRLIGWGFRRQRAIHLRDEQARVDLTGATWTKSARSGGNCDNCVEVAFVDGAVAVRDSKNRDGGTLIYTREEWAAFVGGMKDGEFDGL